jgi:hypothetical protein
MCGILAGRGGAVEAPNDLPGMPFRNIYRRQSLVPSRASIAAADDGQLRIDVA